MDHESGMVLVLRLGIECALRIFSSVSVDQDAGKVPLKPLLWICRDLRFVRLPKTSICPVSNKLLERLKNINLFSIDHERGIVLAMFG